MKRFPPPYDQTQIPSYLKIIHLSEITHHFRSLSARTPKTNSLTRLGVGHLGPKFSSAPSSRAIEIFYFFFPAPDALVFHLPHWTGVGFLLHSHGTRQRGTTLMNTKNRTLMWSCRLSPEESAWVVSREQEFW